MNNQPQLQLLCDVANLAAVSLLARTERQHYDAACKIAAMIAKAHRRTCSGCGKRFRRSDKYHRLKNGKVRHHDCRRPASYPRGYFGRRMKRK